MIVGYIKNTNTTGWIYDTYYDGTGEPTRTTTSYWSTSTCAISEFSQIDFDAIDFHNLIVLSGRVAKRIKQKINVLLLPKTIQYRIRSNC